MPTTVVRVDRDRFLAFLDTLLARDDTFAKLTVSVQRGRIEMVHVDRSYRPDQLPVIDPAVTAGTT
jgi:hypothetical protein